MKITTLAKTLLTKIEEAHVEGWNDGWEKTQMGS